MYGMSWALSPASMAAGSPGMSDTRLNTPNDTARSSTGTRTRRRRISRLIAAIAASLVPVVRGALLRHHHVARIDVAAPREGDVVRVHELLVVHPHVAHGADGDVDDVLVDDIRDLAVD